MLLYSLLAAASDSGATDPSSLSLDPRVLGPLAALVLILFLMELVVPGKTHKRLVEDYNRSRELNEKVIPLAEKMVESQSELASAISEVTGVMNDIVRLQSDQRDHDLEASGGRRRGAR